MQRNLLRQPPIPIQLIVVYGLGLFLGIISVILPPYFIFVGIAGIIYLVVAWFWPEVALIGILMFTSTIFDIYALPSIPIGFGNLIVSDILIFVLIGIIFLRGMINSASYFVRTPLDLPLLAFYVTAILATGFGIISSRITFNSSLGEVRVVNFYLVFFIVTQLIRSEKQLRRLYAGLIFLAIFIAIAMIIQYVVGDAIQILPGRVETLSTDGTVSYGVARVLPPGQSLVLLAFTCLVVQMLFDKKSSRLMVYLFQLGIVGLAVLLTFNRSFWTSIGMGLILVSLLVSYRDKLKYAKIIFWTVFVGCFVFAPFLAVKEGKKDNKIQELVSGITLRMSTLFDANTVNEDSLVYRYIENKYAYPQIAAHPFFGLGLGANYRPEDKHIKASGRTYIHNGHLWLILKTGIIGYLFFMWLILSFIVRSFQNWKGVPDTLLKGIVLSFGILFFGMLFVANVAPIFRNTYWAPLMGVMLGMGEVIMRMKPQPHSDSPTLEELS